MSAPSLSQLVVGIKGAGEMASAIAWRLYQANIRKIFLIEIPRPIAVRRAVSFCEAVYEGNHVIEGVEALFVNRPADIQKVWAEGKMAVIVDPGWQCVPEVDPQVLVDAILAKKNLGTKMSEAQLVIGLGPGFTAGEDVHMLVETNRGHYLGRIITSGSAEPNTGVPGAIEGYSKQRVLRTSADGEFQNTCTIGDQVKCGQVIGTVGGVEVRADIDGVVRGLIRFGTHVPPGLKLGDIDPRGDAEYCFSISDKARAIAGSVLEAILRVYNL
jgi:xanthine dehydrogenase accessory factor